MECVSLTITCFSTSITLFGGFELGIVGYGRGIRSDHMPVVRLSEFPSPAVLNWGSLGMEGESEAITCNCALHQVTRISSFGGLSPEVVGCGARVRSLSHASEFHMVSKVCHMLSTCFASIRIGATESCQHASALL